MYRLLFLFILLFSSGCAQGRELFYYRAPALLPDVATEMKTPGFWVSRLGDPDAVVMDEHQVRLFNQLLIKANLRSEIAAFPEVYSGKALKISLRQEFKKIASAGYFLSDGSKPEAEFFRRIERNLGLENIPDQVRVRFAVIVAHADQRLLPAKEILTEKPGDLDFDELQNSGLDMNTPVAVLGESADHLWVYAAGPSSSGWVCARNLAWCGQDEIKKMRSDDFVVVSEAKADVYVDKEQRQFYGFVRMGARFEVRNFSGDTIEVALPGRDEQGNLRIIPGYIRSKDLSRGYRPYTRRVVIEQAFELLNTPYGWGGMSGEQDCSQFLQEVFSVAGIDLPRNSGDQAKAGVLLYEFAKNESSQARRERVIAQAKAGISLLYMKGHIMLYLGEVDKKPYAIHDVWAYRKRIGSQDVPFVIGRVAVSGLDLGEGSGKGSLLSRLRCIKTIN